MTRSKRLEPVQEHAAAQLREAGAALARSREQLQRQEQQLQQLIDYRDEYGRDFRLHGEAARSSAWLLNYQVFLAQLNDGIQQQRAVVEQCRKAVRGEQERWEALSGRARALEQALGRMRAEEHAHEERREQRQIDDRATRARD